jgi:hypothetical protein
MDLEQRIRDNADEPIALAALKVQVTWWPFSAWWTAKLIRDKQLACIRIGRRVFVTRTLLQEFIQSRVVRP